MIDTRCPICGNPVDITVDRKGTVTLDAVLPIGAEYLTQLEIAVLDAEWWISDPEVAARKDPTRKKDIFAAADAVRRRHKGTLGGRG